MRELLSLALDAARLAGAEILRHYSQALPVERKSDGSPLTVADEAAHQVIARCLGKSQIAVVSEEGGDLHLDAERYWLVDPLDGTKDFLAGNGEFTVNIALVENSMPVLGVVYAPAVNALYFGEVGLGARRNFKGREGALVCGPRSSSCRMAVSRFHDHPDVDVFATDNLITERFAIGSALKYGLLASGDVDVFPRLVGCSEWDTAAGQAILEAAGGKVLDWHDLQPLRYGKPGRRNPRLLSLRAPYLSKEFLLKNYKPELL